MKTNADDIDLNGDKNLKPEGQDKVTGQKVAYGRLYGRDCKLTASELMTA